MLSAPGAAKFEYENPDIVRIEVCRARHAEATYDLSAVALNLRLYDGDVVYSGDPILAGNGTVATIIYADEMRTGGTVAWICRNPGNIRDGAKFGAY
jgi:hypothetical protein